jgi:hypothetical protein
MKPKEYKSEEEENNKEGQHYLMDAFDGECHKEYSAKYKDDLTEENIMFMINVAEQCDRPDDMLMFLVEYFKQTIDKTLTIYDQNNVNKEGRVHQQDFLMNKDVMNSLAIACKKYIENSRQELRISIALARNPNFQDKNLKKELDENISKVQNKIIDRCIAIYKFVDYLHIARKDVSLKFVNHQISKSVLNALLYKLKADMMSYIYECLSGENGMIQHLGFENRLEDF